MDSVWLVPAKYFESSGDSIRLALRRVSPYNRSLWERSLDRVSAVIIRNGGQQCKTKERLNSTIVESNALSLGWHIGFYHFVLAVAGKSDNGSLRPDDQQVLRVVKSRINELAKFFNLDAEFLYPTSPAEARKRFANIEIEEQSRWESFFDDILATHHGRTAAELYDLGKMLSMYPFVADRNEAELQIEKASLAQKIRSLSEPLEIPREIIEECLSQPQLLTNRGVVDRIIDARRRVVEQRQAEQNPKSPWATGSFYLAALLMVGMLFLVIAKTVNPIVLPIVLVASMLGISIIGALQLRNDTRLSEKNFLELMRLALKSLPLLRSGNSRGKRDSAAAHH